MARSKYVDPISKMPNLNRTAYAMVDFLDDMPHLCEHPPIGYFEHERPNPNQHPRKHNNIGGPMRYFGGDA